MSIAMKHDVKRWTAKRKSALVLDIIQGKTTAVHQGHPQTVSISQQNNGRPFFPLKKCDSNNADGRNENIHDFRNPKSFRTPKL